ncbi:MAG: FeoA family protein, partial [Gemmatimonadales bacterium]
ELFTLADARVGATIVLRQVDDEDAARLRYLADQGLTPGTRLSVLERQPFNGPTTVQSGAITRVVGQELAGLLWCEEVV